MSNTRRFITIFSTLAIIVATSGQAMAGNGKGKKDKQACSQTAKTLYQACHFDTKDDLLETNANCINVIGKDARAECLDEAAAAWKEDRKTCKDQRNARLDVCDQVGEGRYKNPLMNPDIAFIDPDEIGTTYAPNHYVSLTEGHTYVLRAGEDFEETVIVHVTDEIREAEGYDEPVLCRVVVDAAMIAEEDEEDGGTEWVPEEVTDDYFAQDDASIVYYCGEISRNFEDGYLDNLDGSFFSGVDFAKAGVLMRQYPAVGQVDRQEYAIAEAEDVIEYMDLTAIPSLEEGGQNPNDPSFACSGITDGDCLMTRDSAALDPESTEYKYYLKDVGFVLAVAMEDGEITGEREELVCVGDSLDVLSSDACGLDDVEELLEELCELSPDAFCPDDD